MAGRNFPSTYQRLVTRANSSPIPLHCVLSNGRSKFSDYLPGPSYQSKFISNSTALCSQQWPVEICPLLTSACLLETNSLQFYSTVSSAMAGRNLAFRFVCTVDSPQIGHPQIGQVFKVTGFRCDGRAATPTTPQSPGTSPGEVGLVTVFPNFPQLPCFWALQNPKP
jgi:hypothetical protein